MITLTNAPQCSNEKKGEVPAVQFVNQSGETCVIELAVDCGCILPVNLRREDFDEVCEQLHLKPETCAERITGYANPLPSKVECKVQVVRLTRRVSLEVFCSPESVVSLLGLPALELLHLMVNTAGKQVTEWKSTSVGYAVHRRGELHFEPHSPFEKKPE